MPSDPTFTGSRPIRSGPVRHHYGLSTIDRSAHLRKDDAWLAARLGDRNSRFLPVWRERNLFLAGTDTPRCAFLTADQILHDLGEAILLGVDEGAGMAEGRAYFALDLSALEDPLSVLRHPDSMVFRDLRQLGGVIDGVEGSHLAYARGIVWWHRRHRYCGICGSPTLVGQAGHVRSCGNPDCAATHFPRTDPAVIMLVSDGDRILLGRQAGWPRNMYSVLAGFVEPGESLEDAVAREVREEAGILIDDVRYHSSQPWPFPASIMLGFTAAAKTTEITIDPAELEEARWFERDWLLTHQGGGNFFLPPRQSIARVLVDDWLGR